MPDAQFAGSLSSQSFTGSLLYTVVIVVLPMMLLFILGFRGATRRLMCCACMLSVAALLSTVNWLVLIHVVVSCPMRVALPVAVVTMAVSSVPVAAFVADGVVPAYPFQCCTASRRRAPASTDRPGRAGRMWAAVLLAASASVPLMVAYRAPESVLSLVGLLYVPLLCVGYSFVMFVLYSVMCRRQPSNVSYGAIVVHGCSIHGDEPTPLLRERLDKAIEAWKRYGRPFIIASGGKGGDGRISEAECMRRYLIGHGVPDTRIIPEHASENTWENIRYSVDIVRERIIARRDAPYRLLLVSSDYHVMRLAMYALNQGLHCDVLGSRTGLDHRRGVVMREFTALTRDLAGVCMYAMFMYMGTLFVMDMMDIVSRALW